MEKQEGEIGGISMNHVMALKELIMGDEEDEEEIMEQNRQQGMGSALNPGKIGGGSDKQEVAKPFAKVEVKAGKRPEELSEEEKQKIEQLKQLQAQQKKKKVADKNDIWKEDEVKDLPIQKNDTRERPEFDTMFKQRVGTEDVYLGTTNMNPTSTKCQDLLIKIHLPGSTMKDIQLDITKEAMVVQSTRYYLHHIFPYPVNDKEGNAKWISDKSILQLTLPIVRDFDFGGLL